MATVVSDELYQAVVEAQLAAQRAHNLAHAQSAPFWLRIALGHAQSILISWQCRLTVRR